MPGWAFKLQKFLIYWLKSAPMCTRTKGGADVMRYRPIRRNSEFGRVYARQGDMAGVLKADGLQPVDIEIVRWLGHLRLAVHLGRF